MGAWGAGLYQDDVTCDIREDYLDRLRIGYTNIEATNEVIEWNIGSLEEDDEDIPLFWFALADTQWKYGRLLPDVKEQAIKYIDEGKDLERWIENKKEYPKRKKVLEELKEKLNSPQPEERKMRKMVIHKTIWNIGDLLLYQIKDDELKKNKWYKKYVLLKVIGIAEMNIGSLPKKYSNRSDIVAIYNWVGSEKPNLDIINKLQFIKEINGRCKYTDAMRIFSFNKKELKKLNFSIIDRDNNYKKESDAIMNFEGICCENINTIDWSIIRTLNNAEEDGTLIDETKNQN